MESSEGDVMKNVGNLMLKINTRSESFLGKKLSVEISSLQKRFWLE